MTNSIFTTLGNLAALALLLLMGWLQLNDPDPLYWISVYWVAAIVPLRKLLSKPSATGYWIAAGMILSGLLISAPGFLDYLNSGNYGAIAGDMMDNIPYVESAREFGGLAIAAILLACYNPRSSS